MASQASPSGTPMIRSRRQRRIARENCAMAEVLQEGLVEFANRFRQPPAPGVEVIQTSRYRVTLQPDYPIPGPNSVSWIRCAPDQVDGVVDEVRAVFRARRLPA